MPPAARGLRCPFYGTTTRRFAPPPVASTRPHPDVMPLLVDLLDDLHGPVAVAAGCALGRAGRIEARPMLARLLRDEPTDEVIDAVSPVADDDCIVQLGRIARTNPVLSAAAIDALDAMDNPRAQTIAATVRSMA